MGGKTLSLTEAESKPDGRGDQQGRIAVQQVGVGSEQIRGGNESSVADDRNWGVINTFLSESGAKQIK